MSDYTNFAKGSEITKKNVEVVYAQKRRIGKIQELVSFHNCNNGVAGWNLRHNRSC
jgi:hypothetical protein